MKIIENLRGNANTNSSKRPINRLFPRTKWNSDMTPLSSRKGETLHNHNGLQNILTNTAKQINLNRIKQILTESIHFVILKFQRNLTISKRISLQL